MVFRLSRGKKWTSPDRTNVGREKRVLPNIPTPDKKKKSKQTGCARGRVKRKRRLNTPTLGKKRK